MTQVLIGGKERNAVRAMLRRSLKAGNLAVRRTYYDYYDSCHAPEETPDAPWHKVEPDDNVWLQRLKMGGPSVYRIEGRDEVFVLSNEYSTYEMRLITVGEK